MQVDVLKSTITDHYTVQTKLDEETKETGLKTQEYYRNWAVLENNSVLQKLVFKLKHKLQSFQETLSQTATQHLKNFILLMKKHYVPEKKSKILRHESWSHNSIKNLAAIKQKLYQRYMQQKTNNKKIFKKN